MSSNAMICEDITIPLITLTQPEIVCLAVWHVLDGQYVTMGQILFDLEMDSKLYSVESLHSGYIKIIKASGAECHLGDIIGKLRISTNDSGKMIIPVELSPELVSKLDERRGEVSRRDFLSSLVRDLLK